MLNLTCCFLQCHIHEKELLLRVELRTSSLPRMRSTTELKQQVVYHLIICHLQYGYLSPTIEFQVSTIQVLSGKRDSNPRPPAWKASALSTELFPQKQSFCESLCFAELRKQAFTRLTKDFRVCVGADGFEPPKRSRSRFTVCPIWPLWNTPIV